MDLTELAMAAYTAYGDYVEWKDGDFDDLPPWLELGEREQGAWMAAASRVAEQVTKEETP